MDIDTWKAMLARRGYKQVEVRHEGTAILYSIGEYGRLIEGQRPASSFRRMLYKTLRREIDIELGHGMEHVMHECRYPLLKAPVGYTCNDPYYRFEGPLQHVQFFEIPLQVEPKSLLFCPNCGKVLERKNVHKVHDPEVKYE